MRPLKHPVHPEVARHIPEVIRLGHEFGVARLEIFGSAIAGGFDPARSDVDVLVAYPEGYDFGPWASRYQELQEQLAIVLGRKVDLVMDKPSRNRFFERERDRTRYLIYDARDSDDIPRTIPVTEPPLVHQRTLKLLEDIRLWCSDACALVSDLDADSLEQDRRGQDALSHLLLQIGRGCTRLHEAEPRIASRLDSTGLIQMIMLADDLRYGSDVTVAPAELWRAAREAAASLRAAAESLIEELERAG